MWLVVVLMIGNFFLLLANIANGWIFFWLRYFFFFILWPLVVLTMVGFEFAIDGGDGLRRI